MQNIFKRLRQPSTWVGLAGIAIYVGTGYQVDQSDLLLLFSSIGFVATDA